MQKSKFLTPTKDLESWLVNQVKELQLALNSCSKQKLLKLDKQTNLVADLDFIKNLIQANKNKVDIATTAIFDEDLCQEILRNKEINNYHFIYFLVASCLVVFRKAIDNYEVNPRTSEKLKQANQVLSQIMQDLTVVVD